MTVLFFGAPGASFDLASFSFQVPIRVFWAKHTPMPIKHRAKVSTIVLAFMSPPVCLRSRFAGSIDGSHSSIQVGHSATLKFKRRLARFGMQMPHGEGIRATDV